MKRMAFKVNDNGKKIVQCLNHFTKSAGLTPMYGNTGRDSYYCIDYDPKTFQIKDYLWADNPGEDAIIKNILPPFMNLPLDIQVELVNRSKYESPVPFLQNVCMSESGGGFDWDETHEGWDFWNKVLDGGDTDLFYKQFKTKSNESRLFEQESPLRGSSREFTSGVRYRVNKARVTVSSLGYKEVVGRG